MNADGRYGCRRSSDTVADGKNGVRHTASKVVSFSAIEKAMLYSTGGDQLQQAPITARWTLIMDAGTSRLSSALLDVHVADDGLLPDLDDAEECCCRRCRSDRRATERLVSSATRC